MSLPIAADPPDQRFPTANTTLVTLKLPPRRTETRAEEREGFINEQWSGRIWRGAKRELISLGTEVGDSAQSLAVKHHLLVDEMRLDELDCEGRFSDTTPSDDDEFVLAQELCLQVGTSGS